jgi:transposase
MENKFAEIPDAWWSQVEVLLPSSPPGPRRGRPPIPDRTILSGIVYRLLRHLLPHVRAAWLRASQKHRQHRGKAE